MADDPVATAADEGAPGMEPAPDTSWVTTVEIKDYGKQPTTAAPPVPDEPRQVECLDDDCDAPGAWHTHPATTPDPIRRKP